MNAISASFSAFQEAMTVSDIFDDENFDEYNARLMRYKINWAFYENSAYRNIHSWAKRYKTDFGLYTFTRSIYNPANRLATFWQNHLMGGVLSSKEDAQNAAFPIVTDNPNVRSSLTRLWRDSNWAINKDVYTLYGCLFGDVGLRVIDDPITGSVQLSTVHPGHIVDYSETSAGVTEYYMIEKPLTLDNGASGLYTEIAEFVPGGVMYTTMFNGKEIDFGPGASWLSPTPFIPLVVVKHNHVGHSWGWSELHPAMSKFREIDDLASKLTDYIRKSVDSPWLFSGVAKPTTTPRVAGETPTANLQEPRREEIPSLYAANPNAKASAMIAQLDINGSISHLNGVLKIIEDEYPELRAESLRLSGDVSARSLKLAQQPAEVKVNMRRVHYDTALIRAQSMAMALGGQAGYPGYEGFSLADYNTETVEHSIGTRPIFNVTTIDQIEEDKAFWEAAKSAKDAGIPLHLYLEFAGWSTDRIERIKSDPQYKELTFSNFP